MATPSPITAHPDPVAHDVCLACWAGLQRTLRLPGVPSRVPLAANCAEHEAHSLRAILENPSRTSPPNPES